MTEVHFLLLRKWKKSWRNKSTQYFCADSKYVMHNRVIQYKPQKVSWLNHKKENRLVKIQISVKKCWRTTCNIVINLSLCICKSIININIYISYISQCFGSREKAAVSLFLLLQVWGIFLFPILFFFLQIRQIGDLQLEYLFLRGYRSVEAFPFSIKVIFTEWRNIVFGSE